MTLGERGHWASTTFRYFPHLKGYEGGCRMISRRTDGQAFIVTDFLEGAPDISDESAYALVGERMNSRIDSMN